MKRTFHLCLSGRNELLFRDHKDYVRGINCLCIAAYKTGASLLAYAFMSNHVHLAVRTEDARKFMKAFWFPYNRYFNNRYGRKGRLGEKNYFSLEIEGVYHLLTAIAYILRNPLHHGITATPFGYRYSSALGLFRDELGHFERPALMPQKSQYNYLPEGIRLPDCFKMDINGMILPESAIDVTDLQHQFSTARTYLYYMNRLSGDNWEKEQLEDNTSSPPITLERIENNVSHQDIDTMLRNEHGRANYNSMDDIQLCEKICKLIGGRSIYSLSNREIEQLANSLYRSFHISLEQISRCLGRNL